MAAINRPSGPPILRQSHLLAFVGFLEQIGAPSERLLRQQSLAVYSDDPNDFVPLQRAWRFFDAAGRTVDPMLGWHVGRYVGDHNLSIGLRRKLEGAPTLYEALKALARLASSDASHVDLGIVERGHDILMRTRYPLMKGVPGYEISQAYQLGIFIDLIRHFAGRSWIPEEIGIEYAEVPKVAEEMFPGSRILVRQRFGYVAVPRSLLHLAASGLRPESGDSGSLVLTRQFDFAETLGTLLHAYLPGGYPPARFAASLMDTSVTTLARRLSDCGTTYRSVVDRARFKAAKDLLEQTDLRITDVGMAVGFDDSSNFARMFRRIGGLSPGRFRGANH